MTLKIINSKKDCTLNFEDSMCIYEMVELKQQLNENLPEELPLKINLAKVIEFDTSGLQILIALEKLCAQRSQKFSIIALSSPVKDLMNLYNLADWQSKHLKE